jgi:hypothetical protein
VISKHHPRRRMIPNLCPESHDSCACVCVFAMM